MRGEWSGNAYETSKGRIGSGRSGTKRRPSTNGSGQVGKFTSIPGNRGADGTPKAETCHDADLEKNFPALWEFLTLTNDGGKARETATLLVFVQDGRLTLCLNDRQEGRSAFTSAPTLREAMVSLEESLEAGNAEWRYRQPGRPGNSRKSA